MTTLVPVRLVYLKMIVISGQQHYGLYYSVPKMTYPDDNTTANSKG